jgi:hypothetical protein
MDKKCEEGSAYCVRRNHHGVRNFVCEEDGILCEEAEITV